MSAAEKIEEVLSEVETLAAKGYKEVVLTGIHLSSYGVDFPKEERESLLSLIQAVSRVEGISRDSSWLIGAKNYHQRNFWKVL